MSICGIIARVGLGRGIRKQREEYLSLENRIMVINLFYFSRKLEMGLASRNAYRAVENNNVYYRSLGPHNKILVCHFYF